MKLLKTNINTAAIALWTALLKNGFGKEAAQEILKSPKDKNVSDDMAAKLRLLLKE